MFCVIVHGQLAMLESSGDIGDSSAEVPDWELPIRDSGSEVMLLPTHELASSFFPAKYK